MANAKEMQDTEEQAKPVQSQPAKSPKPQGSDKQSEKKGGCLFGLLAGLTAFLIIAAVIGGAFYIIMHNNVNGLGERYRKQLQGIPLVKLALPPVADPGDPKYLTPEEITAKYQELRKKAPELEKQLADANKKIEDLQKNTDELEKTKAENEKIKKDAEDQKAQIEQQKKQLEDERKALNEIIASGDKDGFKAYFEKVDKDTAQKIYTEVMQQQKVDQDTKKFAQLYESMDASAAAQIFEGMGNAKIDLIVTILKNLKKENSAAILAAMTADFAGRVTDKLSKAYMSTPTPVPTSTPTPTPKG